MSARAAAAWSAAALAIDLSSANPIPRVLVAFVALNVLLARRRDDARLGPLTAGILVAMATSVVICFLIGTEGEHVLLRIPGAVPIVGGPHTLEGILYGLDAGLGIAAAILAAAPLFVVVEPTDLADTLPGRLRSTGAAVTAALVLVPGLLRSATAVREAQLARGAGRAGLRDLAVPVVVGALERSVLTAEVMEARGHGPGPRTSYPGRSSARRSTVVVVSAALALLALVAALAGGDLPAWNPLPSAPVPTAGALAVIAPLLLLSPLVTWTRSSSSTR